MRQIGVKIDVTSNAAAIISNTFDRVPSLFSVLFIIILLGIK
jgi:hypothetical protein